MRLSARGVTARTFQALSTRNYRYFFSGQLVSVTGSWLQSTAQAWLILELTHSAFMLGLLVMVQFLPNLLLQPFGGVIADRFPKRTLLLFTQSSFALVAGVLGVTVGLGIVRVWEVFLVVAIFGLINVIDGPTRQAFIPEMVEEGQLPNAVALNSTVFNAARVVGPAVGGVLIATVGTALCFDLNAISYLAVLGALYLMHPEELHLLQRTTRRVAGTMAQIREGASYAMKTPEVALVMILMLMVGTFSYNFSVLIPALAKEGLHSGATTFGLLSASLGVGALLGALGVAYAGRAAVPALLAGCAVFGTFLALSGQAASLVPAMGLLTVTGAGMIVYSSMSNSIIQLYTPAALRGRVMALYLWVFMGTTPIGSPLTGMIEQAWGSRVALAISGFAALATAVGGTVWWSRRGHRHGNYAGSSGPLADAPTA
ncbi:MAG TPA: MFS transporter [Candidatus Dormibacteraeota bacterium]|nr:MFS transporter [Candidatus Dormibacteraeota bacterium]